MPLGVGRIGRPAMIGHPVARTAAVASPGIGRPGPGIGAPGPGVRRGPGIGAPGIGVRPGPGPGGLGPGR
jgi:hypothetical protein